MSGRLTWAVASLCWLCGLCTLTLASPARGDGPLGPDGTPIQTSNYAIDLYRGPVLSSTRVTGLGGAFTAVAEGTEGGVVNPAAVAARPPQSVDFWDYYYGLGLTYPFETEDFFNSGHALPSSEVDNNGSFLFFNPGGYLQLWRWGFGLNVEISVARLENESGQRVNLQFLVNHVQLGYPLLNGELIVGGGLQVARQRFVYHDSDSHQPLLGGVGFGGEIGAIWRPDHARWRLGGSLFSRTTTTTRRVRDSIEQEDGDLVAGSFYLPRQAINPWRGSLGFAYQFGPRPTNVPVRYVEEQAAAGLEDIAAREDAVHATLQADLAALRRDGAAPDDLRVEARQHAAEAELQALQAERDALELRTWRSLRHEVREGWPRHYLLLTADLQVSGRVDNAVGVESFFAGTVQRAGQQISLAPHLGVEGEAWPGRMKLRGGAYVEPTRFGEASSPRFHGTLGFDLRLLHWDVFGIWPEDYLWQLSAAVDVAREYNAVSVSLGGWY